MGVLIGGHVCNKSILEMYLLLNIPQSTVGGYNKVEAIGSDSNSATKWLAT